MTTGHPVAGIGQMACIERNTFGVFEALTASRPATQGSPGLAKVSLDAVVEIMSEMAYGGNIKTRSWQKVAWR